MAALGFAARITRHANDLYVIFSEEQRMRPWRDTAIILLLSMRSEFGLISHSLLYGAVSVTTLLSFHAPGDTVDAPRPIQCLRRTSGVLSVTIFFIPCFQAPSFARVPDYVKL